MNSERNFQANHKPKPHEMPLNVSGPTVRRDQYFWFIGRTQARPNGEFCKGWQLADAERDTRRLSPAFKTLDEMWNWVEQSTKYCWRVSFAGSGQRYVQLPGDPEPTTSAEDKNYWQCWHSSSTYQDMCKDLRNSISAISRARDREERYMRGRKQRY